jgi:hypothetical protein
MAKDETTQAIPIGEQNRSGKVASIGNIIDAISLIQQFAVMESSDYEIPEDFLTLRGSLNFFNVGFGNGFIEGLIFTILLALIMPIMHSDYLTAILATKFPLAKSRLFLWMLNLSPLLIAVILCSYLSRYRIGKITKKAVDALLVGRMFSLLIKMVIVFVLLILFYRYNEVLAYYSALGLVHVSERFAASFYQTILNMKADLLMTAFRILIIFGGAVMTPFFTIWFVSFYRSYQRKLAEKFWKS